MALVTAIIVILMIATFLTGFASFGASCILTEMDHYKAADILGNITGYLAIGFLFEIAAVLTSIAIESLIK